MDKQLEEKFVNELECNQNIVHKICRIYTSNPHDHKDLFQEVTIQLWKAYPNFRGDSKFSTWMYRIALNTAITLYRKSTRRIKTSDLDAIHFKLKDEEPEDDEHLKQLYKAIRWLSDIEKALIFLYLEDTPYKEIAETLGISEGNVRVKLNRTKNKLKQLLNP